VAGVRDTIASGQFNGRFLKAARVLARHVASTRPSPAGGSHWAADDIDDLVFETIKRVTPGNLVLAANKTADDRRFRSYLLRAMRSTLDIRARGTVEGRVIRAVQGALDEEPERFWDKAGHWGLRSDERDAHWFEGLAPLIEVAWTVETTMVRFSPYAERTPPMASRHDIREVAAAVLDVSGPLPKVQLAEVLAYRFNVSFESGIDHFEDNPENALDIAAPESTVPLEATEDAMAALWMHDQLTEEERLVLSVYLEGGGQRGIATRLGCSKHKAGVLLDRIEGTLVRLARLVDGDAQAATELLFKMCRTRGASAAFPETEEHP
jgi:hypothetical protein